MELASKVHSVGGGAIKHYHQKRRQEAREEERAVLFAVKHLFIRMDLC